METAKLIKEDLDWEGDASVYELSKPLGGNKHVVVSAVVVSFSGPETYIFGCNNEGGDVAFSELDGSYKGGLSHEEALSGAGYEIVK